MGPHRFLPYRFERLPPDEMLLRARSYYEVVNRRRSIRHFSDRPVPKQLIELAIRTASAAPSGAHRQPWRFVAVSDPEIKHEIRIRAEREEKISYQGRMPPDWLETLEPLGTNWEKPYLDICPWIVVVFAELHGFDAKGARRKNYYVQESVGVACGFFITALHHMGLHTLTHTPSPMAFLSEILQRPANERPYILFPIGYPAAEAMVPDLKRKTLDEVAEWKLAGGEK